MNCPRCSAPSGPGCLVLVSIILCCEAFALFIMVVAINPITSGLTVNMTPAYDELKPIWDNSQFVKVALGMSSFFSGIIGCFNTIVFLNSQCMKSNVCLCLFVLWPAFIFCWATAGTIVAFVGLGTLGGLDDENLNCYIDYTYSYIPPSTTDSKTASKTYELSDA